MAPYIPCMSQSDGNSTQAVLPHVRNMVPPLYMHDVPNCIGLAIVPISRIVLGTEMALHNAV